jgi:hypothetical protein
MPFASEKQKRFMFAKHPEIAKRWVKEAGGKVVIKKKRKVLKGNYSKNK